MSILGENTSRELTDEEKEAQRIGNKGWSDLNSEQKHERSRTIIKGLMEQISKLKDENYILKTQVINHEHNKNGTVLIPLSRSESSSKNCECSGNVSGGKVFF